MNDWQAAVLAVICALVWLTGWGDGGEGSGGGWG
jgi:hypothetical protein